MCLANGRGLLESVHKLPCHVDVWCCHQMNSGTKLLLIACIQGRERVMGGGGGGGRRGKRVSELVREEWWE